MTDLDRPPGPEGGPIAETIARVRELDAAATKGPWRSCDHAGWAVHPFVSVVCERDREVIGRTCMTRGKIQDELANAALISYYRTAAPLLADECERLRERVARLEEALREIAGYDLRAEHSESAAHEIRDEARAALEGK